MRQNHHPPSPPPQRSYGWWIVTYFVAVKSGETMLTFVARMPSSSSLTRFPVV